MQDQNSNPYASPNAPIIEHESQGPELASFAQRLLGAIVDGLIMLAILMPIMFVSGYFAAITSGVRPGFFDNLKWGVVGFVIFLVVQGYFLNANGQTIGKKVMGTRIVTLDNEKPEFIKLIALRYLSIQAISQIPILGAIFGLVNALFIFAGDQRQCLHDKFAGTKVIVDK